jgi:plasmid stabilization system protein ParE
MPALSLSLAESALRDLEELRSWYAGQGVPEVGERLVAEILLSVEDLALHPEIGRVVPEFGQPFLRELIHPPFRVVYRREPERVRVVRVWRSERLLRLPGNEGSR